MSLQKDGKHISWTHIVKVYEQNQRASGLYYFNKKLRREHVYLNSYSRMRVNLAAQVYCVFNLFYWFNNVRFSVLLWPMLLTITEIQILQGICDKL
jgi:hypothetical protein